jgi:glycosyltransferase involved in cell wall biosynthesis
MRILTFAAGYPPFMSGGPAVHTHELNLGLARLGHEPWVVAFHPPEGPTETELATEDGVHVCRVQNFPFLPHDYTARFHQQNGRALEGVLRVLEAAGGAFDLIVLQGYWLATAAMALHATTGVPVVFHVHNMYSAPVPGQEPQEAAYFRALESWAIRESAWLIPISEFIAGMCLEMGADRSRMSVIPKGLHLDHYAGDWIPHDNQTLLFVGRLSPEKGLETLLQAVASLRDAGVPVRALLAGAGDEPYVVGLQKLVADLDLRRHVAFLGFIGGHDLIRLYQTSTVTVIPSYMEALGRVALEAMASGAPVIVTDVGGLGPLVRQGETGWKVPDHDPAALAAAIREVFDDRNRAASIAATARQEVAGRFSWDRVLADTMGVYELAGRGRG